MENLRWILIFAGVAILVLLYFSGRPKRNDAARGSRRRPSSSTDIHDAEHNTDNFDPLLNDDGFDSGFDHFADIDADDFARPGMSQGSQSEKLPPSAPVYTPETNPAMITGISGITGTISQKIESFSERLSPKRRQRVAASEPADLEDDSATEEAYASKIVTLHLVAPAGHQFDGEELLNVFEQRGYHFGEMNIFHSMHHGKTVFSIAKMVEPGYFDIDQIDSFHTPGVSLIMQLPGPVPADVAFEVLISEAFDMANELGGNVLDADRSTLSKQTVQHMREGIYEYMHRQKYFGGVPS